MLFHSLHFLPFAVSFFLLYWMIPRGRVGLQNALLLIAGYYFYSAWDIRFTMILAGFSLFNYLLGLLIGSAPTRSKARLWLILGLVGNIGTLILFKYYNFFMEGLIDLLSGFGIDARIQLISLFLPVGISFYTFISVSYLVDVYRQKLEAEKNPLHFFLTIGFFPILLAGPIERPLSLLPQIKNRREFDKNLITDGLRQFLWGLTVKLVIADNCAVYANKAFTDNSLEGSTLFYGAIFYAIQIYADFSSYSDMAIGVAKLFGFRLVRNFRYPYFATDIADFWKRWHISLTSWFRDYLFLPVAWFLSRKLKSDRVWLIPTEHLIYGAGILLTWTITGLWHGAAGNFILWGMIHAMLLIFHQVNRKNRKRWKSRFNLKQDMLYRAFQRITLLTLVTVAWVFFRSKNLHAAIDYLNRTLEMSLFSAPVRFPTVMILPVAAFFTIEWFQRDREHGLDFSVYPRTLLIRWSIYAFLLLMIFFYQVNQQQFIYFKF